MTEHLDRAIEVGEQARAAQTRPPVTWRDWMMPSEAGYRAFTAALLEGLSPSKTARADPAFCDGFNACLDAIRERAGIGGNDDPA